MNWVQAVTDNMVMLKAAGYGFAESWAASLEQFPSRMNFGAVGQMSLLGEAEPSVAEFLHDRCWESWFGTRCELVDVAKVVSDLFGFDGGGVAAGRNVEAPL